MINGTAYVKEPYRNCGYSAGLEYPMVYGDLGFGWCIWHRHTGRIAMQIAGPALWAQRQAFEICWRMNGLNPNSLAGSVRSDMEMV